MESAIAPAQKKIEKKFLKKKLKKILEKKIEKKIFFLKKKKLKKK